MRIRLSQVPFYAATAVLFKGRLCPARLNASRGTPITLPSFAAAPDAPLECRPACHRPTDIARFVKAIALEPLPYTADSRDWFLRVRTLGNAVWLDSAFPHSR